MIDEMVAHAREDLPNECCGMIGGDDGEAQTRLPGAQRRSRVPSATGSTPGTSSGIIEKEMRGAG